MYKRIGLLDHLGHGNLGDDATLDAMMRNIKQRWPESEIIGLSLNPCDTYKRHGIASYAIRRDSKVDPRAPKSLATETDLKGVNLKLRIKDIASNYRYLSALLKTVNKIAVGFPTLLIQELWFLLESFRITKSLDLLIVSGGGQLLDSWGGPWGFPYTLFKWVVLAKLSRAKCYLINVGAGPISHPLSKRFINGALFLSEYASFRDNQSRQLIQEIGFTRGAEVLADTVYSLDIDSRKTARPEHGQGLVVGLSPMAYCDPRVYWDKNQDAYESYIGKLGCLGSWLIRHGHRLSLFSTDIWFDSHALEDLTFALEKNVDSDTRSCITQKPLEDLEGLVAAMSTMSYIVTSRFHGVVFAHMMNIPVLAISHHPKVATLMEDIGLADYCVDIRAFDPDLVIKKFLRLLDNQERIKSQMADKLAQYRKSLSVQFDNLFYPDASSVILRRCVSEW